jgi:hypothetical protein
MKNIKEVKLTVEIMEKLSADVLTRRNYQEKVALNKISNQIKVNKFKG